MRIRTAIAAAVLGCCPAWAWAAGPYVGAAGAYVERPQYSDVDGTFGGKVFAGYRFSPAPIFVEASYLDAGKADISSVDGVTLGFKGYTVGGGYFGTLSPLGSGAWLRASFYSGKSKLEDKFGTLFGGGTIEQDSNGLSIAVGAQWKPAEWFGLRAEYESLIGAKDFSDDKNIGLLSLGVVFEFGQEPGARRAATAYSPPPPAGSGAIAAPPVQAPPAAPSPVPAAAPSVPSAPVAAPSAAGQSLAADTPLKVQPRAASQTQLVLPAGSAVQASRPLSNNEGSWYYVVDGAGHSGWVPAQALSR